MTTAEAIVKNVQHFVSGVIHWEKLPQAIKCIDIGSRAFVQAVRAFQEAYNLVVDGELGPITMAEIEKQQRASKPKSAKKKKVAAKD